MRCQMLKKFKDSISSSSLEVKILILAAIGGLVLGGISSIINIVLNLGPTLVLITLGVMVIALLVLYLAFSKKSYKFPAYSVILLLILVIYPLLWFYNNGSQGPTLLFMIFIAVLSAVLLNKYKYWPVLLTHIIVTCLLLIVELRYPSLIAPYETALLRSLDIIFSFLIVFLTTFALVSLIMREYNRSINTSKESQSKLEAINAKLKIMSEIDELTGLYNRRYVLRRLHETIISLSGDSKIGVIMIDIDHFKKINDSYGHGMGDKVLNKISQTLKENIRKDDIVGRIGGEEFLILMPNITEKAILARAEILRQAVCDLEWDNKKIQVTISGGVYLSSSSDNLDKILEQADLRLYQSKNQGRNRISYHLL